MNNRKISIKVSIFSHVVDEILYGINENIYYNMSMRSVSNIVRLYITHDLYYTAFWKYEVSCDTIWEVVKVFDSLLNNWFDYFTFPFQRWFSTAQLYQGWIVFAPQRHLFFGGLVISREPLSSPPKSSVTQCAFIVNPFCSVNEEIKLF